MSGRHGTPSFNQDQDVESREENHHRRMLNLLSNWRQGPNVNLNNFTATQTGHFPAVSPARGSGSAGSRASGANRGSVGHGGNRTTPTRNKHRHVLNTETLVVYKSISALAKELKKDERSVGTSLREGTLAGYEFTDAPLHVEDRTTGRVYPDALHVARLFRVEQKQLSKNLLAGTSAQFQLTNKRPSRTSTPSRRR